MPHIVMTKLKEPNHDKTVKAKIMTFLQKLQEDDTSVGLNIEKMKNPVDQRARTGRVDLALRAVLYRIDTADSESVYVYAGTWEHDEAIERARTRKLRVNPVNGIAELIEVSTPESAPESHRYVPDGNAPEVETAYLHGLGYNAPELMALGFEEQTVSALFAATSADELLTIAETFENQWQESVVLGLAVGDSIEKITADLAIDRTAPVEELPEVNENDDEHILESFRHPASQMQFTLVENNEELRRVLEDGDFGAWRVFLHPEQRKYATQNYNGPFRLSGGAGTGKTVVLLHRSRHLHQLQPNARIVLTTFTKALAGNLQRDLERLDPTITLAQELASPGVLVRGIDALAAAVKDAAGSQFPAAASAVLGGAIEQVNSVHANRDGWREAIDDVDPRLPEGILTPTFFEAEYLQVILPNRVTSAEEYAATRRPGRGIALDRARRAFVWDIIEQYRKRARLFGQLSFAEVAEIGAAWLESRPEDSSPLADHILIDEGQDLVPSHWRLIRAIVPASANDVFIAEDTHQRIYGQHVVLSRYGLKITGRSRRLTLNYRTTEQNLRYAMQILKAGEYVDSANDIEGVSGYRSARRGPAPQLMPAKDDDEQFTNIAELVGEWLDLGVAPGTIAVLARSNNRAKHVQDALAQHGISAELLTNAKSHLTRPVVLTMHTAKGMEFSRVILFDASEGSIPLPWALQEYAPEEMDDALLRERSLLYVAASRARDELVVSWKGAPSSLLLQPN
jgi:superfamily I DNA/RNA helicase